MGGYVATGRTSLGCVIDFVSRANTQIIVIKSFHCNNLTLKIQFTTLFLSTIRFNCSIMKCGRVLYLKISPGKTSDETEYSRQALAVVRIHVSK